MRVRERAGLEDQLLKSYGIESLVEAYMLGGDDPRAYLKARSSDPAVPSVTVKHYHEGHLYKVVAKDKELIPAVYEQRGQGRGDGVGGALRRQRIRSAQPASVLTSTAAPQRRCRRCLPPSKSNLMLEGNVMMARQLHMNRVIGDFWERGLVSPISLRRWARGVTLEEYSQFHLVLLSTPAFYAARSWEQIKALVMSNADWNALLCNYHGTYGFAFKFRPGFGPKNAKEGTFYVYTSEASYYGARPAGRARKPGSQRMCGPIRSSPTTSRLRWSSTPTMKRRWTSFSRRLPPRSRTASMKMKMKMKRWMSSPTSPQRRSRCRPCWSSCHPLPPREEIVGRLLDGSTTAPTFSRVYTSKMPFTPRKTYHELTALERKPSSQRSVTRSSPALKPRRGKAYS